MSAILLLHRPQDRFQHKPYKRRAIDLLGAFIDGLIVHGLMFMDQTLHRQMCKQRLPIRQNQGLPHTNDVLHPSITIRKLRCRNPWNTG